MKEKILEFLKRNSGYASGEEISQRLGLSRQGLWKHIQELKGLGYDIVAVPHLGYHLVSSPDRLLPMEVSQGLATKFLGKKIYYFEECASTMDAAMQLGAQGAAEGTLVIAEAQRKGRGRLGRQWFSPKYKGIYLSLLLRPKISPSQASVLTLLSGVSVSEAIKEACGIFAQIKWPNDILIHNRKAGGILTELNAEMDEVRYIIIGIGLNVNNDKKSLISGATSLREQKKEPLNRVALLQEILRKLELNYLLFQEEGARPIIEKWRELNITLGRQVRIVYQTSQFSGQAVDIDEDGALLFRNASGLIQRVTSADIIHCR